MKKIKSLLLIVAMLITILVSGLVSKASSSNIVTFDFNSDTQGWAAPYFMTTAGQLAITQENGALKCQMLTGWRPITAQVFLANEVDGSIYDTVHLKIKNPTLATQARVGFGYSTDAEMLNLEANEYNFQFAISASDSEYKDYYINLGEHQTWSSKNNINFFRVQLCLDTVSINQSVYIDTVEIYDNSNISSETSSQTSSQTSSNSITENTITDLNISFNNNTEGFVSPGYLATQSVTQEDGNLRIVNGITAKHVVQLPLTQKLDGSALGTLHIRLKNSSGAKTLQLAFATEKAGGYYADIDSTENFIRTTIDNTDRINYRDYYINLSSNSKWKASNDINMIRLIFLGDFEASFFPGSVMLIDNLRLYNKAPDTEYLISFASSVNGWAAPGFVPGVNVTNEENAMKIRNTSTSKMIVQSSLDRTIDGTILSKLHLRIKNNAGAKSVSLSFGTLGDSNNDIDSENNSFKIMLDSTDSNNFKDYYVDLADFDNWRSSMDISLLRLIFYGDGGSIEMPSGSTMFVSSMKFYQNANNGSLGGSSNPNTDDNAIHTVWIIAAGAMCMLLILESRKKCKT